MKMLETIKETYQEMKKVNAHKGLPIFVAACIALGAWADYSIVKSSNKKHAKNYETIKTILPQKLKTLEKAIDLGGENYLRHPLTEIENYKEHSDGCLAPLDNLLDEAKDIFHSKEYVSYVDNTSFKLELNRRIDYAEENIVNYQQKKTNSSHLITILAAIASAGSLLFPLALFYSSARITIKYRNKKKKRK